jgi:hypothetical protein
LSQYNGTMPYGLQLQGRKVSGSHGASPRFSAFCLAVPKKKKIWAFSP